MTALAKRGTTVALTARSWEEAWSVAQHLAKARGFVPDHYAGKPEAILAAIAMGSELGLGPMQSLRSIYVVNGRPTLSADLMLALAIRAGVKVQWLEQSAKAARVWLTRDGFEPHEHAFTMAEADAAGLTRKGGPWKQYPAAMLRARCVSSALRAFCPDVLGAGVYVEGELGEQQPSASVVDETPPPQHGYDLEVVEAGGEAVCGAAEQPTTLHAPERMSDCQTAEELQAWCRIWGGAIAKAGNWRLAAVLSHGEAIGVGAKDVRGWLGLGDEEAA